MEVKAWQGSLGFQLKTDEHSRFRFCSLQAVFAPMTFERDWPALGDRRVHRMSRLAISRRAKHPKMTSATESPMGHLAKTRDLSL